MASAISSFSNTDLDTIRTNIGANPFNRDYWLADIDEDSNGRIALKSNVEFHKKKSSFKT
jgi:hypothetical protein